MGNTKYPTISHVLPFFHLLIHKHNSYLRCKTAEDRPNYDVLLASGKPKSLIDAVLEARKKLLKYFFIASSHESIHSVATSSLAEYFIKLIDHQRNIILNFH